MSEVDKARSEVREKIIFDAYNSSQPAQATVDELCAAGLDCDLQTVERAFGKLREVVDWWNDRITPNLKTK